MRMKLAPSILAADFKVLGEEIRKTEEGGAEVLHFDVMDGVFVPNISFGMPVLASIQGASHQIMDVHLMVTEPIRYVEEFVKSGADIVTVHWEACEDIPAAIEKIKEAGAKAGISIKPGTAVSVLEPVLEKVDMVLIMSVEPGFGGQKFMPEALDRIQELKQMIDAKGLSVDIEVDGGISTENVRKIIEAGANVIVAGSTVFKGDVRDNAEKFMEILREYE